MSWKYSLCWNGISSRKGRASLSPKEPQTQSAPRGGGVQINYDNDEYDDDDDNDYDEDDDDNDDNAYSDFSSQST